MIYWYFYPFLTLLISFPILVNIPYYIHVIDTTHWGLGKVSDEHKRRHALDEPDWRACHMSFHPTFGGNHGSQKEKKEKPRMLAVWYIDYVCVKGESESLRRCMNGCRLGGKISVGKAPI